MGILSPSTPVRLDISRPSGPFGDPATGRAEARGWNLLANVPVPLRHCVRDGVADQVKTMRDRGGEALRCCFPMGQGGVTPFQRLRFIRHLDDFPDMLVSAEHGNAFNRRFYARHMVGGDFRSGQPGGVDSVFTQAGLVDPQGWVGVFAVAPFVWLIDRERLGELPVPRRWADLADPIYAGQVVFGGWRHPGERRHGSYNKFFLQAMAHDLGLGAVARILANVPGLLHSAQMPRLAGTDASPGGIYVAPLSLADLCPRRHRTYVAWPEDGALAFPLWLTLKSSRRRALAPLVDYFHGPHLARLLNANRYPALCPGEGPVLPDGAKLKWPGWDYLRHPDSVLEAKAVAEAFDLWQENRACA